MFYTTEESQPSKQFWTVWMLRLELVFTTPKKKKNPPCQSPRHNRGHTPQPQETHKQATWQPESLQPHTHSRGPQEKGGKPPPTRDAPPPPLAAAPSRAEEEPPRRSTSTCLLWVTCPPRRCSPGRRRRRARARTRPSRLAGAPRL